MTEKEIRKKVVEEAKKWLGVKEGSLEHRQLVDLYNSLLPLPRGYKVKYTDSWCDLYVSVIAYLAGVDQLIGRECGCEEHIKIFKKLGIWEENGSITPKEADIILYNWDDNTQPNDGYADHIGWVTEVNTATGMMKVIEGNYSDQVKIRNIAIGDGRIRGYARPNYAAMAEEETMDYQNLGWNHDGTGWWYATGHSKGQYHKNNAVRINDKLYFFDTEGYCVRPTKIVCESGGAMQYIYGERV